MAAILAALALTFLAPPVSARQAVAGVNAHLMWSGVSAAEQDRQLGLLADAGAGIVRVDVGWSSLEEKRKGTYERWYLDRLDGLVDRAERHGVKLLLTLTDSPCWASSAPAALKKGCEGEWWDRGVDRHPPVDAADYADALAFLVRRYGNRVEAWEIWNEPNQQTFFKSDRPAADYARIVRAAYPAAKGADASATVLAGSLAESPAGFVEQLFEHGIGGHFDAFSIHPYAGDAAPNDPGDDDWIKNSFARGIPSVREVLMRHGEDKPIWLTEFGWSTSTIRGDEPWRNGVTEAAQARYTEQALLKVRDWPYVPVAIVFELVDERDDPDDRESNFGLVRHDGTLKPAYHAFKRAAEALADGEGPAATRAEPARLRLSILRTDAGVYVRGTGTPHAAARLRAHRYLPGKGRFARRASVAIRVRMSGAGRFTRRLDDRLARGRWRVTASYLSSAAGDGGTRLIVRGGRSV